MISSIRYGKIENGVEVIKETGVFRKQGIYNLVDPCCTNDVIGAYKRDNDAFIKIRGWLKYILGDSKQAPEGSDFFSFDFFLPKELPYRYRARYIIRINSRDEVECPTSVRESVLAVPVKDIRNSRGAKDRHVLISRETGELPRISSWFWDGGYKDILFLSNDFEEMCIDCTEPILMKEFPVRPMSRVRFSEDYAMDSVKNTDPQVRSIMNSFIESISDFSHLHIDETTGDLINTHPALKRENRVQDPMTHGSGFQYLWRVLPGIIETKRRGTGDVYFLELCNSLHPLLERHLFRFVAGEEHDDSPEPNEFNCDSLMQIITFGGAYRSTPTLTDGGGKRTFTFGEEMIVSTRTGDIAKRITDSINIVANIREEITSL